MFFLFFLFYYEGGIYDTNNNPVLNAAYVVFTYAHICCVLDDYTRTVHSPHVALLLQLNISMFE